MGVYKGLNRSYIGHIMVTMENQMEKHVGTGIIKWLTRMNQGFPKLRVHFCGPA